MNILTIAIKNMKWRLHHKMTLVITILQPMLWLILYSSVTGASMKQSGIENYTAYILPGLMVLVCFSACGSSGILNYMMKTDGSFYRILIAPVSRSSILLGQLVEAILCSLFEVTLLSILAAFFSVNLLGNIGGLFIIVFLISLTAFFMSAIANGISLLLPNEMLYETFMNAIVLPIFFLSSALAPVQDVGGFLKIVINLNPFTHVINSIRAILLEGVVFDHEIVCSILLLSLMSLFAFLFAYHQLLKET